MFTELLLAFCTIGWRFPKLTWKQLDGWILNFHFSQALHWWIIHIMRSKQGPIYFIQSSQSIISSSLQKSTLFYSPNVRLCILTLSVLVYSQILYLSPHFYFSFKVMLMFFLYSLSSVHNNSLLHSVNRFC